MGTATRVSRTFSSGFYICCGRGIDGVRRCLGDHHLAHRRSGRAARAVPAPQARHRLGEDDDGLRYRPGGLLAAARGGYHPFRSRPRRPLLPRAARARCRSGSTSPTTCAEILALALLSTDQVWLFTRDEARELAQQHNRSPCCGSRRAPVGIRHFPWNLRSKVAANYRGIAASFATSGENLQEQCRRPLVRL